VIPGIECSTGALGHGLPFAFDTALSLRLKKSDSFVYVLTGDGECQEGSIWEAAASISKYNLTNLIWIIDCNGLQGDDEIHNVINIEPLQERLESFGFDVLHVDGHAAGKVVATLKIDRHKLPGKPLAVIANTVKGKGISILENRIDAHSRMLTKDEYELAFKQFNVSEEGAE
jgi:transketolase